MSDYTIEQLAQMLYQKMEDAGYRKGTDKTKWREVVMAEKLGHMAYATISSGKDSEFYGSDAITEDGLAEYKTITIEDKHLRNLNGEKKKNGNQYAAYNVVGVYNGYNGNRDKAHDKYSQIDHYFGVFYKEKCLKVIKVKRSEVIRQLETNYWAYVAKGKKGTTNCNQVRVSLADTHLYEEVYAN